MAPESNARTIFLVAMQDMPARATRRNRDLIENDFAFADRFEGVPAEHG